MAIDKFHWHLQVDGSADVEKEQQVRSVALADGYEQVGTNGINSERRTYPLTWKGSKDEVQAMDDFLSAHYVKAFVFTPPGHPTGIYRVKAGTTIKTTYISSRVRGITATLVQAFGINGA